MRRGRRERREKSNNVKYLFYVSGGIVLIMLATFVITFIVYNNKLKNYSYSSLTAEKIADLVPNDSNNLNEINTELEQASSDIGKTIEEAINSIEETKTKTEKTQKKTESNTKKANNTTTQEAVTTNVEPVKEKDPEFVIPVEGEIMRSFAKDSLIYSETLEEWVTHLGIDIKADRTSVVKAAEAGTITSIKNDPRYGLSLVIEHTNGFKSVYSNLLTTEFVSEGEKIEKGQNIGTVGNSAAFEIVDEPHLHFEIIKDNVNVDPNLYIK